MDPWSFLPPFFGVLAAFGLNYLYTWARDRQTKCYLLRCMKAELNHSKQRLDELQGKTVPMDNWKLVIHSGRGLLFDHEVLLKIGRMYFALDNYAYEIKLVRQFSEQARQAIGTGDAQAKQELAAVRWQQAVEMQKNLSKAIEELLKEDFWPRD